MTISSSPDRYTFQKENYIKRKEEQGLEPLEEYIEMFKTWKQQDAANLVDPEWQKNNMQYDLRSTAWICDKAKASDSYSQKHTSCPGVRKVSVSTFQTVTTVSLFGHIFFSF